MEIVLSISTGGRVSGTIDHREVSGKTIRNGSRILIYSDKDGLVSTMLTRGRVVLSGHMRYWKWVKWTKQGVIGEV